MGDLAYLLELMWKDDNTFNVLINPDPVKLVVQGLG
jgi:hypothetical protein